MHRSTGGVVSWIRAVCVSSEVNSDSPRRHSQPSFRLPSSDRDTLGCGAICLVHTGQGNGQHWRKEENTSFINQDGQRYICTGGSLGVSPCYLKMTWGSFMETKLPVRAEWLDLQGSEREQWQRGAAQGTLLWTRRRDRQLFLGNKGFGDCFLGEELLTVDRKCFLVLRSLNNP